MKNGRRIAIGASILAFGVVGWEHLVHSVVLGHGDTFAGHALHIARDGALALPIALAALALGVRLAPRLGGVRSVAIAATVSLTFALLLVPASSVHSALDAAVAPHGHDALEQATAAHGVRDALVGQAAAFPLAAAALAVVARRRRRRAERRPHTPVVRVAAAVSLLASLLAARPLPTSAASDPCGGSAPQRAYSVSAINVRITYNRFGDNDPGGFMYALDQNIAAVRAQEASRQVSTGLRKDAIQPLVLRGNVGECLVITFRNQLTAGPGGTAAPKASIHAHGFPYQISSAGSAVGLNPGSMVAPGSSAVYKIFLAPAVGEGAHVFHSHGDDRQTAAHGLFGAIVAEPAGSAFLDPETGQTLAGGNWEAIIQPPTGAVFREFAMIYHEVGDEGFDLKDSTGGDLPRVDDLSDSYKPGGRALNYRTEPFRNRLKLADDKSQGYGSYTFGDPSTPIPRSYLGEPTKSRLIHAGTEMAHVHHQHGGGIRWRRNPRADETDFDDGLKKSGFADARSVRLDSQLISPSETYNLEHECGAGGCQQSAGDFLYHCHIAHHYISGMWSFWRVFDTSQSDLAVLPGRAAPPGAVDSAGLIGRVIEGKTVVPQSQLTDPSTQRSLESWVEAQLPPQGVRLDSEDATVWDWQKTGPASAPVYVGEPDDTTCWANFCSPTPGQRPAIKLNPLNGRYTWPLLRPHLGKRPPFSGNRHTGAPWLGDTTSATRPDGLCPQGASVRTYDVTAIAVTVPETKTKSDPNGEIFVLNEDKGGVLAGTKPAVPLAIRSNVGDCVALTLASQLVDNADNDFHSKVNMHTHFVQFDPQASDGVISGLSFEQSVRPFPTENRTVQQKANAGATTIKVSSTSRLRAGIFLGIGQGATTFEMRRITAINTGTRVVTLDAALSNTHPTGEAVGVEFVQYRWFSDVDSGTVFWHDHVNGIKSWDHGLFGAHIIEPPGSTYHDPKTGAEVRSGPIVDIRTAGSVGTGQAGSFREFMVWLHNDIRAVGNDGDNVGSINLRAEPFGNRGGASDPHVFSSVRYGDPFTPLPRAYVGDPFVIRTIGLVEKEGALRITGHRFRPERFSADGELYDAGTTGISERFDYVLDGGAGGPGGKPGDYLYYSTRNFEWEDGAWGVIRVHDKLKSDLQPLPGRTPPSGAGFPQLGFTGSAPPQASGPGSPCPAGAPARSYDVTVFRKTLPVSGLGGLNPVATASATVAVAGADSSGVIYALSADEQAILDGTKPVVPLAIRANAGDCVDIRLTNHMGTRASLGALAKAVFDPQGSYGSAIGFNPDSTVAPNATYTYRFYADRELGTSIWLNLGDVSSTTSGGYGALVVEPAGATYTNPKDGSALGAGLQANVVSPSGNFREFVALIHATDDILGRSIMPYNKEASGFAALDYENESLGDRLGANPDPALVFSSTVHGDPDTPLMRAYVGDPVRFRVAVPASQQFHVFLVEGHAFPLEPRMAGSETLSSRTVGPGESLEVFLKGGAGGPLGVAGDYLYLDHRYPFTRAGMWGILRVHGSAQPDLVPLG